MNPTAGKTSYTTRFSYAASDVAGQLVFTFIIGGYLSKFFTDTYGIPALICGTIIAVARFIDAIDAPVWGMVFDKTHSRWGKSRPWFLWLCFPFAVFGVLTFLTPELGHIVKTVHIPFITWKFEWTTLNLEYTNNALYAAATYIVCSVLYTGINTPVTSILSGLTADPQERVTLTCFRMFGSKLGVLIVNLTALHMVKFLGRGDDRKGFMLTLPIYAAGSIFFYLLAFKNLKETIPVKKTSEPILGTFRALKNNWPWLIIFSSSFLFWIGFIARVSTVPYFFQYDLHRDDLTWLAYSLDFVSLATAFLLPWVCRWTSKRTAWVLGLVGMVIGQLIVYLGVCSGHSVAIIMAGWTFGFLSSGMAMAMPFSVLSDSVDYGEWKNGVRAAGLLTAIGAAFCLKAGAGLGGAIPLWIMGNCGYVPNVEQTAASLRGIEFNFIWLPAICLALSTIPVLFYKRFELLEPQIHAELEERRKKLI
jgi:sugar (glycoside-pentoside-hexuronide) transporter